MIEGFYVRIRKRNRIPHPFVRLSVGWKLVSLRLSKPTPNSISGTVQLPKSAPGGVAGAVLVGGAELVGKTVMVPVTMTVISVWKRQLIHKKWIKIGRAHV